MIDLDPRSPVPLYRQIVDRIRRKIVLGALRPGDKLPTVRELAVQARVNRNTAARAVQALESDGWVSTRVGKGTFVESPPEGADREDAEKTIGQLLDRVVFEAHSLGLPLEELGWTLSRRIDAFRVRQNDNDTAENAGPDAAADTQIKEGSE